MNPDGQAMALDLLRRLQQLNSVHLRRRKSTALVAAAVDALPVLSESGLLNGRPKKASNDTRLSDFGISYDQSSRWQKLGDKIIGYAHGFTVDALAQLGRMLKATPRNAGVRLKGRDGFGGTKTEPPNDIPTLADLGLDKKTSSLAQRLAELPEQQLEEVREGNLAIAAGPG